jgi:hypothetical protein
MNEREDMPETGEFSARGGRLIRRDRARWGGGCRTAGPAYEFSQTWNFPEYLVLAMLLWFLAIGGAASARAELQFDVFFGYNDMVPEAAWFPIVCEIKNDGPTFKGRIEVTGGNLEQGEPRNMLVELPTGTLKRVVMMEFSTTRGYADWNVRLLDERGRKRDEKLNLRPRKQIAAGTPLLGALSRRPGGAPVIRATLPQNSGMQPVTARLLPSIFPDNPLALEGMTCLYLNSERAADLGLNQVNAIRAWVNAGGHLIVAVEQPTDITGSPWLRNLFPCELKELQTLKSHSELQSWLRSPGWPSNLRVAAGYRQNPSGRNRPQPAQRIEEDRPFADLADDLAFELAGLQVATGSVREGRAVVSAGDIPLVVTANRGRGRITALMFSPEREPVLSWKNLPVFWARLTEVPGAWYASSDFNQNGGWSSDGIFGAMIDSRQVHKMPLGWLLLLLTVYLVVIGPLDHYWLKRIGRPMLTWITFPCYVVGFSLVIYLIGYKLRSGESEWNEIHVVDVLANGDHADLRGRTYSGVYSPANQKYALQSQEKYATLRSEFSGNWGGAATRGKASVMQTGDGFEAEIFVPVWTPQLFVSDWWQAAPMPLSVSREPQGDGWQVKVWNHTDRKVTHLQMAAAGRITELGEVGPGESKTFTVSPQGGRTLQEYVMNQSPRFQNAVQSRGRAFGGTESGWIDDLPGASTAVSFLSQGSRPEGYMGSFISPPGLDMSSTMEHGGVVLLAWADNYSPVKPMYQFSPRRSHSQTLWRFVLP